MSLGIVQVLSSIVFALIVLKIILPARGVEQITTDELRNRLKDESIQFIDVRSPAKFQQFHIFGFKNIPLKYIRQQARELDKDRQVVVICQTGSQGNRACKRLKRYGFKNLTNVRGGLSTWEPMHIDRT